MVTLLLLILALLYKEGERDDKNGMELLEGIKIFGHT